MKRAWNGSDRRNILGESPTNGDRREVVRSSVLENTAQLYQMEHSIRIIFKPEFNVWQVFDLSLATWEQLLYEIAGVGNQRIVFEFAMLTIKMKKYGLNEEEDALYNTLKGTNDVKEYEGKPTNGQKPTKRNKNTHKQQKGRQTNS